MKARVTRTHRRGRPVDPGRLDLEQSFLGDFALSFQELGGLRRATRVANLRPLENTRAGVEQILPPLYDIELLTFGDGAMVLSGFEEDGGTRYYQSWYVRWK